MFSFFLIYFLDTIYKYARINLPDIIFHIKFYLSTVLMEETSSILNHFIIGNEKIFNKELAIQTDIIIL
jgi:hypothetical protein